MDSQHSEHDSHGEAHGIHLPDPSIWPFVVGLAAFVAGIALIFWSRTDNAFSGPLLGVGITVILIAAAGWAYEDTRMRRKAESGEITQGKAPRYTQVLTFAIAEGQLDTARGAGGVLDAVEASDLRDLEGFQDLRINVSPAMAGPSQVIVETTWKGRDGLDTYESSRRTLLDVVNAHGAEVLPGTVQVFDMEVVRDTKDTSFKFPMAAATTMLVGFVAFGAILGTLLSAFQSEGGGEGGSETPPPATNPYELVARDNSFNKATLQAPPDTEVTFTFDNRGNGVHNVHFLTAEGGDTLAPGSLGDLVPGPTSYDVTFTTPGPGSYYYICDAHPTEMSGTLEVTPDAPPPGGAPPAEGEGTPGAAAYDLTATDNSFDKDTLQAPPETEVTFTFDNAGTGVHSLHFLTEEGGETLAPGAEGKLVPGPAGYELTFTTPGPGSYYYICDAHPTEMNGTLEVTPDAPPPPGGGPPTEGAATPTGTATN